MNRGNLNRNGLLVLGLCFGLFLASAAQCKFNKKLVLNGFKRASGSHRMPSNSGENSGRNASSNSDESSSSYESSGGNGERGEIKRGIKIVKEALKEIEKWAGKAVRITKSEHAYYANCVLNWRLLKSYEACGVLYDKLKPYRGALNKTPRSKRYSSASNKTLHLKQMWDVMTKKEGSRFEELALAADLLYSWGGGMELLYRFGDEELDRRFQVLSDEYAYLKKAKNASPDSSEDFRQDCVTWYQSFCLVYDNSTMPYWSWQPDINIGSLVRLLTKMESGLREISDGQLDNFNLGKIKEDERKGRICLLLAKLICLFSKENVEIPYTLFGNTDYDKMAKHAEKLPNYLKKKQG